MNQQTVLATALRPCPFCGSAATMATPNCVNRVPRGTGVVPTSGVRCSGCGVYIRRTGKPDDVRTWWNTRV